MNKAIYPGTFDPITRGHEDIIRRAAGLFEHVIVAVADSRRGTLFHLAERIEFVQDAVQDLDNVTVLACNGLLMDFAKQHQAKIIVRGLRAVSDFEYEFQLAGMNRKIYPAIETLFLTPSEQYMFLSATMVREIARFGGSVHEFVTPLVASRLQQQI